MHFCRKVENIFGSKAVTPNMHMHAHLKEVILDYGPLHAFWLFSYERFNGILGNYPNNNKCIESQLMNKFLQDSILLSLNPPQEFENDFDINLSLNRPIATQLDHSETSLILPPRCTRGVLSSVELESLKNLYLRLSYIEAKAARALKVNSCVMKYSSITFYGVHYSSCLLKSSHHYIAMAEWNVDVFGMPLSQLPGPHHPKEHIRPVQIILFELPFLIIILKFLQLYHGLHPIHEDTCLGNLCKSGANPCLNSVENIHFYLCNI